MHAGANLVSRHLVRSTNKVRGIQVQISRDDSIGEQMPLALVQPGNVDMQDGRIPSSFGWISPTSHTKGSYKSLPHHAEEAILESEQSYYIEATLLPARTAR